jgi:hypothetical protein
MKSIRKITISLLIQWHSRKQSSANTYNYAEFVTAQLKPPSKLAAVIFPEVELQGEK